MTANTLGLIILILSIVGICVVGFYKLSADLNHLKKRLITLGATEIKTNVPGQTRFQIIHSGITLQITHEQSVSQMDRPNIGFHFSLSSFPSVSFTSTKKKKKNQIAIKNTKQETLNLTQIYPFPRMSPLKKF